MLVAILSLLSAAAPARAVDPRALIERAIAVEKEKLPERSRYFGREDIRVYREENGKRRQRSWTTYEAMIVDGRVRYKIVARNGKPLKADQQKLQPETARFGIRLPQLLVHHDLTLAGVETISGRAAWHVVARLRPEAPRPVQPDDLVLLGSWDLWIDQQTGQERKAKLTVERAWRVWPTGATVEHLSELHGGTLFLNARSVVRRPEKDAVIETEQVMSAYRRFSSEASITFDPQ